MRYDDEHKKETKDIVWGTAYRIALDNKEEVMKYLNYREKNGYSIQYVDVHLHDDDTSDEGVLGPSNDIIKDVS